MIIKFASLFLVVLTQSFASYAADDHPRRGIEHVDSQPNHYGYWYNYSRNDWISGYGYHLDRSRADLTPNVSLPFQRMDLNCCPVDKTDGRTLTTDIREAILDDTRFLLALRRQHFGDAWRMGLQNE